MAEALNFELFAIIHHAVFEEGSNLYFNILLEQAASMFTVGQ